MREELIVENDIDPIEEDIGNSTHEEEWPIIEDAEECAPVPLSTDPVIVQILKDIEFIKGQMVVLENRIQRIRTSNRQY